MGWSCGQEAGDVLTRWYEQCTAAGDASNAYMGKDGVRRFFAPSRTEHRDGAITGLTSKHVYTTSEGDWYGANGSFRIEGNGEVTRYPTSWPFPKEVDNRR